MKVKYTLAGLDIKVIGAILMVIGIFGLITFMLFWSTFARSVVALA